MILRRLALITALACLLGAGGAQALAESAGAASASTSACGGPATYHDENGSGATVTINCRIYRAGATVRISGTGFRGYNHKGGALIVIKGDDDAWMAPGFGGRDAVKPGIGGRPTYSSESNGTFSGWLKLPHKLPGGYTKHYLRVLAGTYGNSGAPKTFQAFFRLARPDRSSRTR